MICDCYDHELKNIKRWNLFMLSFRQTKQAILATIGTSLAINIIGDAGVGKTQMVRGIAKENQWNMIEITASNLKEGELSFPMLTKNRFDESLIFYAPHHSIVKAQQYYLDWTRYKNKEFNPYTKEDLELASLGRLEEVATERGIKSNSDREELIHAILDTVDTNYKVHKFEELAEKTDKQLDTIYMENMVVAPPEDMSRYKIIESIMERQPKERTVYFVDEVGRMAPEVGSEMMNFILDKQVNGNKLPPNVVFITAQNPSKNHAGYEDSMYDTVEMDPATASRLFHISMRPTFEDWVKYASEKDHVNDRQMVHQVVIEFISEATSKRLFVPADANYTGTNSTNPRSWKHVSDLIYNIEANPGILSGDDKRQIVTEIVSGKIDASISKEFMDYYFEKRNPLPTPKEIFGEKLNKKNLDVKMGERIENESNDRKLVLSLNLIEFLSTEGNSNKNTSKVFAQVLSKFDKDLMLHPMIKVTEFSPQSRKSHSLTTAQEKFYNDITNEDIYLDLYHDVYSVTKNLKDND